MTGGRGLVHLVHRAHVEHFSLGLGASSGGTCNSNSQSLSMYSWAGLLDLNKIQMIQVFGSIIATYVYIFLISVHPGIRRSSVFPCILVASSDIP